MVQTLPIASMRQYVVWFPDSCVQRYKKIPKQNENALGFYDNLGIESQQRLLLPSRHFTLYEEISNKIW